MSHLYLFMSFHGNKFTFIQSGKVQKLKPSSTKQETISMNLSDLPYSIHRPMHLYHVCLLMDWLKRFSDCGTQSRRHYHAILESDWGQFWNDHCPCELWEVYFLFPYFSVNKLILQLFALITQLNVQVRGIYNPISIGVYII